MSSYPQEWVWRNSKARGVVKYVLLAIARFTKFRGGKWETPPVSAKELAGVTGLGRKTIERSTTKLEKALEELLVFRAGRHGEKNRYALAREMKLPLDVDPLPRRSERPLSSVTETDDVGHFDRRQRSQRPLSSVTETVDASDVRTKEDHDHDHDHDDLRSAGEADADLQAYATFWKMTYPDHNHGVQSTLNIKRYGQAVRDVLAGGRERRSLALVQDMTVKLWTVKADPRSREATYIATKTDRSPNILRDHASWLEADVKKDATARESAEQAKNVAQHTATARQREIDRCIATLKRQPDTGILGAACADAAAQLQADTFDAAAIDAWLLSIARTVVDQNELERLAREELAAWRPPKMSRDHYEHTIRTKVDRLLREHAKLPDLTVLAEYDGNRRPTSAAGM